MITQAFCGRLRRIRLKRTIQDDFALREALREAAQELENVEDEEPETPRLLKSDPADWKDQDHYAVLGLSLPRWTANEDDIKRAYRRKVLKHHPDKNMLTNDSFFKCIQRAWEVMSDTKKRRQWDSCDPKIPDAIPKPAAVGDFFEMYAGVFARETRFSKTTQSPPLGDLDSTRVHVEEFYSFWFGFESWRTFERMDEEDTDKSEGRNEKRWLDRKNKSQRQKLKKDDGARVGRLVDQAFAIDPRIKTFKALEKAAKEAKRAEKDLLSRAGEIAAAKKAEEERILSEAMEAESKAAADLQKKLREATKNAIKKEKKAIKRVFRDFNNLFSAEATPDMIINRTEKIEFILENLHVDQLEAFKIKLESELPNGIEGAALIFELEHIHTLELVANGQSSEVKSSKSADTPISYAAWQPKEVEELLRSMKSFAEGSGSRWEKIAAHLSQSGTSRIAKECILKAKTFQKALNVAAPIKTSTVESKSSPSVVSETKKVDKILIATSTEVPKMQVPEKSDWTTAQQLQLEAGLRQFPASNFKTTPGDRWVSISKVVEGKTAKDIKTRVKCLADLVKKKK